VFSVVKLCDCPLSAILLGMLYVVFNFEGHFHWTENLKLTILFFKSRFLLLFLGGGLSPSYLEEEVTQAYVCEGVCVGGYWYRSNPCLWGCDWLGQRILWPLFLLSKWRSLIWSHMSHWAVVCVLSPGFCVLCRELQKKGTGALCVLIQRPYAGKKQNMFSLKNRLESTLNLKIARRVLV
jgi:hypothetical protein